MKDFPLLHGGFLSGTNLEEADYDTWTPMHVDVSANNPEMEEKLLYYRSTSLRRGEGGRGTAGAVLQIHTAEEREEGDRETAGTVLQIHTAEERGEGERESGGDSWGCTTDPHHW
ncbi:UNVERIFIED_CONTAM: hypothetical protein FKN15_031884 [Acipenser sinensis]